MLLKCTFLFLIYGVFLTSSETESLFEKRLVQAAEGTKDPLPSERFDSEKDVKFLLYTQKNPKSPEYISVGDAASLGNFNGALPTKIVVHGWISNPEKIDSIRAGYIATGSQYNTIMVDWSSGASNLVYATAKGYVVSVGERVADLLDFLVSKGLKLANVNLVGHSLGAHVVGVAGNRIKSGTVGRITGLDPAAPLYGTESLANRLDSSDAAYVEVVHTCGGVLGWADALGHVDFFPNGGIMIQPGCGTDVEELGLGACSHNRVVNLFAESITTKVGFVGRKCDNWLVYETGVCSSNEEALMGDKTPTSAKGSYFLKTHSSSPYAEG